MTLNIRNEVIWLTRGRNWGSRFLSTGPFSPDDAIKAYDKIFSSCDDIPYCARGCIIRNEQDAYQYLAQRFYDSSRRDVAGRRIIHEIVAVSDSKKLEFYTDATAFCECVKDYYDRVFGVESETVDSVDHTICVDFNIAEQGEVEKLNVEIGDTVTNDPSVHDRDLFLPLRFIIILLVLLVLAVGGVIATRLVSRPPDESGADDCRMEDMTPNATNMVARKLQQCDFLLNAKFKKNAKIYFCLFSASWCEPCRAEMLRMAKIYAETLKDDPDIELIHFSCDRDDDKAMVWVKECDGKFPVVKPNGGNPFDLHPRSIPHLYIVKADGAVVEDGHPAKLFTEKKLRVLKQ